MVTKPVGQVRSIDPACCEIGHETLLVIDGCVEPAPLSIRKVSVANAWRAATDLEDAAVQPDHLPQGEISHQARR